MTVLVNRGLSAVIAIVYLTLSYLYGSGRHAAIVAIALLFPLMCIWFAEAVGEYTGLMGGGLLPASSSTPAVFVRAGGWFLLVGLPLILYFVMRPGAAA